MDSYIIKIEKDTTGKGRYQLALYINDINNTEPFQANVNSFKEIIRHAVKSKEAIEKEKNIKLNHDAIKIDKKLIDEYKEVDPELKEFISNHLFYTDDKNN